MGGLRDFRVSGFCWKKRFLNLNISVSTATKFDRLLVWIDFVSLLPSSNVSWTSPPWLLTWHCLPLLSVAATFCLSRKLVSNSEDRQHASWRNGKHIDQRFARSVRWLGGRFVTAQARPWSPASPCGIFGRRSSIETSLPTPLPT